MIVVLIPLAAGVVLAIRHFDWLLLGLMVALVALAFPGNGYGRGQHGCSHCRQRELGCLAEQLFRPGRSGPELPHCPSE